MARSHSSPSGHPTERIFGHCPAIRAMRTEIRHLVAFDAVGNPHVPTVLVHGETGTGKGLVARVMHDSGPRAHGPFIDVNCAAIPETLLEAELFGFLAGAFTDAKRAKTGLFEAASGGTLFLDEIDALPLPLQSKFLKAVEDKRIRRLGAVADQTVDVKVMAATAADLRASMAEGRFRPDLYHRLAVVVLEIPPLRERGEDIVLLAQQFLQRYAESHGVSPKQLSRTAEEWLQSYAWPGNVRELSHLMERATLLHPQALLDAPALEQLCLPLASPAMGPLPAGDRQEPLDEATRIQQALQQTGGNVVRAAQLLGLSRNALRYRMSRYGIGRPSRQAIRWPSTASSERPIPHSEPVSPPVDSFSQRTPFVARERELATLRECLARVLGGRGQAVGLVGEPGVGKSRLLDEFRQGLAGQRLTILEGRCMPYGHTIPYLPMRDVLKAYFQVGEQDEGRAMRQKVAGKLLSLDRTLAPMLPPLLALLGETVEDAEWQALDPFQRRQQILDAVTQVLRCESRFQPLVLILDDLHWNDPATHVLLDALLENLVTTPVFLLVTYRPEYQPGWPPQEETEGSSDATQLRLDPLPVESAQTLLAILLGRDSGLQPLTQLLLRRTEGNPLFLVESIRTLVETKILLGEQGAYRLAPTFTPLRLPATVEEAMAARIDRLPPQEKHLLQTAAVIGMDVPVALLQAIVELPMEAVQAGLALLQSGGFLDERRLGPELSHTFPHPLTYEVAYESLPQEQRRVLHARIVEASERLSSDRLGDTLERLAQHALQGALWTKAVDYLRRASDRAAALSVHRQAVVCLEQGLMALQHLPENRETREQAIDLRLHLSDALLPLGEPGRVLEHLRQAEPFAESLDDYRRLGQISVRRGFACWLQGEHQPAIAPTRRALAIARALGDFAPQVRANLCLGQLHLALGHYQQALKCLRWNIAFLEGDMLRDRLGMESLPSVTSRVWMVWCCAELGEFAEAMRWGEEGVQLAEAAGHPLSRAMAAFGAGLLCLRQGDPPRAIPLLEQGLEGCQGEPRLIWFPWIASCLGLAYALGGRIDEALPLLEQSVEQAHSMGILGHQSLRLAWLGEAYLRASRREDAIPLAAHALELARDHQERGCEGWALRLLGEIAAHGDPPQVEPAEDRYRQAMALADELGMRPLQARCHLDLGSLYRQSGRFEQGHAEVAAAVELFRAMDMPLWLGQAEAALLSSPS